MSAEPSFTGDTFEVQFVSTFHAPVPPPPSHVWECSGICVPTNRQVPAIKPIFRLIKVRGARLWERTVKSDGARASRIRSRWSACFETPSVPAGKAYFPRDLRPGNKFFIALSSIEATVVYCPIHFDTPFRCSSPMLPPLALEQ